MKRPFWKRFFRSYQAATESFVSETVWEKARFGEDTKQIGIGENPLISGYSRPGALALAAYLEDDENSIEWMLDDVGEYFLAEMREGNPKRASDLTPKQRAIIELDELRIDLQTALDKCCYGHRTITLAMTFGAALMRYATQFPDSPLEKWMAQNARNRQNARAGGKARATCTDEQITTAFSEYKKRNPRNSYASAELSVANKLGYSCHRKIGQRIKGMTGNTAAKWYKTLP